MGMSRGKLGRKLAMDGSENVQQEIMNSHLMQLELRMGV